MLSVLIGRPWRGKALRECRNALDGRPQTETQVPKSNKAQVAVSEQAIAPSEENPRSLKLGDATPVCDHAGLNLGYRCVESKG